MEVICIKFPINPSNLEQFCYYKIKMFINLTLGIINDYLKSYFKVNMGGCLYP